MINNISFHIKFSDHPKQLLNKEITSMAVQNTKELENKLNPVTDKAPEVKVIEAPKRKRIRFNSTDDYIEVAACMLGYSEEEHEEVVSDSNEEEIEEKLYDKFNVSIDELGAIIEALLPMTMPQEKAISGDSGDFSHVMGVFDSHGFRSIVEQRSMLKVGSEIQSNEEKPE